jgi:hypothetical protein
MLETITPRLDILPEPQRQLWNELQQLPEDFVLYGGTAIALRLGHRQSIDFDFFSNQPLGEDILQLRLPLLHDAEITQRAPDTLSCIVERKGFIKLSFFGVPKLPRLIAPAVAFDNKLRIASLLDLAGTKASVVQVRAESKDYVDIDALLSIGGLGLGIALASASALYGKSFNPQVTLKALTYFEDDGLRDLAEPIKLRLVDAVRRLDLAQLPQLPEPHYRGAT